jgi:hypothetical protein
MRPGARPGFTPIDAMLGDLPAIELMWTSRLLIGRGQAILTRRPVRTGATLGPRGVFLGVGELSAECGGVLKARRLISAKVV